MKSYVKIVSVWIGLLIWSTAVTCGAAAYYSTMEQPPDASEQIKAANEFSVRPLISARSIPKTSATLTRRNGLPIIRMFQKHLRMLSRFYWKKRKLRIKKLRCLQNLNWNAWRAQPDEFICKIAFINAASGQKIFSGMVNVNSRSGNPYAQVWGGSFSLRLQAAAYNTAWVLTKIMTQGKVEPADY